MDLTETIVPKSDQLNAEDLLTGPRTFTVADVKKGSAEQLATRNVPVAVAPVLRINEPPMPETVAYVRRLYGPAAVIVVDPEARA